MRRLAPAVLAASAALAVVVLADPALRVSQPSPAPSTSLASSTTTPNGTTGSSNGAPSPGGPSAGSSSTGSSSGASSSTPLTPTTQTVTGPVVQTRWGPVQVVASVSNRTVTSADAVVTPSGQSESDQINAYAVPVLNAEAIRAGSAQIDTVTGATVTSDGYRQSLQAILDGLR